MVKRIRAESPLVSIEMMAEAAKELPRLPKHVTLRRRDKPFFNAILRARMRIDWPEYDLVVAAQLARVQADIEEQQPLLDAEGVVVANERGAMVKNPRIEVVEMLHKRELAMMRALRIAGTAVGNVNDLAPRMRKLREAEAALNEVAAEEDSEELLLPS